MHILILNLDIPNVTEYEKRDHVVTKIIFCFNLLQE